MTSEDRIYGDAGPGPMMSFFFYLLGFSSLYLAFLGGVTRKAGFPVINVLLVKCKAYIPLSVDKRNFF